MNKTIRRKKFLRAVTSLILIIALTASPTLQLKTEAAQPRGIDVSVYQGNVNWQAVAADGISFAFVRVGTTKKGMDAQFANNMNGATAAGIRTGVYIYSYATSVEAAAAEANIVLQAIQGYTVSFPVVIDIEDASMAGCPPDQLAAIANTFCGIIQGAGYYPMVYANKNWFTNRIGPIGYDKWVAQYAAACTYPNPAVWQATNAGRVNGVPGNVDINYLYKDFGSIIIPGGFAQRDGKTFYYENYRMKTGWVDINGGKYLFDPSGAMVTGWVVNGPTSFYFQPTGVMQTGLADIEGHRYYFNEQGQMQRGLIKLGEASYFFNDSGHMHTGWFDTAGGRLYFRPDGSMATGWTDVEGSRYYFSETGVMQTGLIQVADAKYYFGNEGKMHTGWFDAGGTKFYFRPDGSMVTGWADLDGHRYFFEQTGQAAVGLKQIEKGVYYFNADGSMQTGWSGNIPAKYYFLPDGNMAKGWQAIDGAMYYFKEDGVMNIGLLILNNMKYYNDVDGKLVTGWKQIANNWYLFTPDGVLVSNTTIDVNGVVCQFDPNGVLVAPAGYVPIP